MLVTAGSFDAGRDERGRLGILAPMVQGPRFVSWLGPLSLGAIVACVLTAPATAAAAPKGKGKGEAAKTDAAKTDAPASNDASDEGSDASDEGDEGDEGSDASASGGEAAASVSTSGASGSASGKASRGGKKGEPMKGRFGFGAMRTVSGLNGLFGRYYLGNRFTLGLDAGFATFTHRETDDNGEFSRTRTVGAFAIGPEAIFWPVQGDRSQQVHADFGVGARVLTYVGFLGLPEEEQSNTLDTPVEIDVEIPAAVQVFIGPRIAISPEFGFVVRIIPGSREPDENGDFDMNPGTGIGQRLGSSNGPGLGFELGSHAGFFMGIGVGYYFGKLK